MSARCKPKQDENGKYLSNGQSAKSGLNRSIADAGWGMFVDMLEYKAEWQGKNIIRIGRFEPSSKTCSDCGWIHKELSLQEREWVCRKCGTTHDRDVNAAKNIKAFALEKIECIVELGQAEETAVELGLGGRIDDVPMALKQRQKEFFVSFVNRNQLGVVR